MWGIEWVGDQISTTLVPGLTKRIADRYTTPLFNIDDLGDSVSAGTDFLWVMLVLLVFWKLPRSLAVVVGACLGLGGSRFISVVFGALVWSVRLAASCPTVFVTSLWVWTIVQTSIVQGTVRRSARRGIVNESFTMYTH